MKDPSEHAPPSHSDFPLLMQFRTKGVRSPDIPSGRGHEADLHSPWICSRIGRFCPCSHSNQTLRIHVLLLMLASELHRRGTRAAVWLDSHCGDLANSPVNRWFRRLSGDDPPSTEIAARPIPLACYMQGTAIRVRAPADQAGIPAENDLLWIVSVRAAAWEICSGASWCQQSPGRRCPQVNDVLKRRSLYHESDSLARTWNSFDCSLHVN